VRVISSVDDMIVPVVDLYGLAPNPNLKVDIHPHGGHMGYLTGCPPRHAVGSLVRSAIESF
jgi:predicted alpha/beta-fold hydrolase